MNLDELGKQLDSKKRSFEDLARYISTRTEGTPNYTLLLGAGCSVTSGVRPATALCDIWRTEIVSQQNGYSPSMSIDDQRHLLKQRQGHWYDPQKEYSCLFEKKYDLQRQRRMFVENEVKNATPSIGYAYLTALVDQDYFNTIFTTNFDDLLNEAFFLYSQKRPIVCAHDSSINSITVTSKRPKIIKLHGDYLFDDIKATNRETESLDQNMKEKFIEFAKDFGLVVVGYAGGDRSIIDLLTLLLKNEDYFKNGIYWCLRKNSDIPEDLRRLFWKDRVYFVEIEGFDELFSSLFSEFNAGECLPLSATKSESRYENMTTALLSNQKGFPLTTPVLKNAHSRLTRLSTRKAIANQIINPESKEHALQNVDFTDKELLTLTQIQRTLSELRFLSAIDEIKTELSKSPRPMLRRRLLILHIDCLVAIRETEEAIKLIDSALIAAEPKRAKWWLKKSSILTSAAERKTAIEKAIELNDQSVDAHISLANWHIEEKSLQVGEQRATHSKLAQDELRFAIKLNPQASNRAWHILHNLLSSDIQNKGKNDRALDEIEDKLAEQNRYSWSLLKMRTNRIDEKSDSRKIDALITDINNAKDRDDMDESHWYDAMSLHVYHRACRKQELEKTYASLIASDKCRSVSFIAEALIDVAREVIGDEVMARRIAEDYLSSQDFDHDVFYKLYQLLLDTNDLDAAYSLFDKNKRHISANYEVRLLSNYHEARGEYEVALRHLETSNNQKPSSSYINHKAYLLILMKKPEEAKTVLQVYLASINSSPEAPTEIINYELARKLCGSKPDTNRLGQVLQYQGDNRIKAAVAALRDHKQECLIAIKDELRKDKTFKYQALKWPVFESLKPDMEFKTLLST